MQETAKITLSPAQLEVVNTRGCHVQVIACAGSGKTESVSRRVAALIAEGVKSEEIVAFTFTDRAATELKERIVRRVGELAGDDAAGRLAQMYVGTIHGFCASTQASATCAGVLPFRAATAATRSTSAWFANTSCASLH